MKTLKCFILFILLLPIIVYAEDDNYIENVTVLNGNISPKFDKYNNKYSITIDDSIEKIDFDIKINDTNKTYKIINNENLFNNKEILIILTNSQTKEENIYSFIVHIEKEQTVFDEVVEDPFVKKEEKNYVPYIVLGCFSIILCIFYFIFLRKKSYIL